MQLRTFLSPPWTFKSLQNTSQRYKYDDFLVSGELQGVPLGAQGEPKRLQECPKGSQRLQKEAPKELKISKNEDQAQNKVEYPCKVRKHMFLLCFWEAPIRKTHYLLCFWKVQNPHFNEKAQKHSKYYTFRVSLETCLSKGTGSAFNFRVSFCM